MYSIYVLRFAIIFASVMLEKRGANYKVADPNIQIDNRRDDIWNKKQLLYSRKFDKKAAVKAFLIAANDEKFMRLITSERHYTRFMTKLIIDQLTQTQLLQQSISQYTVDAD